MADFEPALVILSWKDPKRLNTEFAFQMDARLMDKGKDDMRMLPNVPYRPTPKVWIGDSIKGAHDILGIDLVTEGADTVVKADSYVMIPVTYKNTRTHSGEIDAYIGKIAEEGFIITMEDTVAFEAGVRKEWGYLVCPEATKFVLGHRNQFTSRVCVVPYDDT